MNILDSNSKRVFHIFPNTDEININPILTISEEDFLIVESSFLLNQERRWVDLEEYSKIKTELVIRNLERQLALYKDY